MLEEENKAIRCQHVPEEAQAHQGRFIQSAEEEEAAEAALAGPEVMVTPFVVEGLGPSPSLSLPLF
jgi:hypothetical protein